MWEPGATALRCLLFPPLPVNHSQDPSSGTTHCFPRNRYCQNFEYHNKNAAIEKLRIRLLGQESFRRHRKIGLAPAQEHLDVRWLIRVGDLEEFALWAKEFFDRPRGSTRLHRAAEGSAAAVDIRVLTAWTAMRIHSLNYRCSVRTVQPRQHQTPTIPHRLNQQCALSAKNCVWAGDLTFVSTGIGRLRAALPESELVQ